MNEEPSRTVPSAYDHSASLNIEDAPEANIPDKVPENPTNAGQLSGNSVEARLQKLEKKLNSDIAKRQAAAKAIAEFNASNEDDGPLEEGWGWFVVKVIQYIIGFTLSLYALFITFYGLSNGYSKSSPCSQNMIDLHNKYEKLGGSCEAGPLEPILVIFFLILLLTVLAFCEGTQIALMLLEKVRPRDISPDIYCYSRVKRTHEIAQNNTERYLLGRQIFVTGIVFMVAKLIGMKPSYAFAVSDTTCDEVNGRPDPECATLGPQGLGWFGSPTLVSVFVDTGFAGSLIVLAFGQLLPQLIVTTIPLLQYQLFPTYEIIWIQLFCERLGVAEMAGILRKFTRYVFNLKDEDFGVGSGVEFAVNADATAADDEDEELSCCTSFWMEVPFWQQVIKVIIGLVVFVGSIYFILENILSGKSDFTKVYTCTEADVTNGENFEGDDIYHCSAVGAPRNYVGVAYPGWKTKEGLGDVSIWIQLLFFLPFSNIIMGYLEGSQIAILALEKAPPKVVKRTNRDAYFGHKLTQQRDNVRRYLLGRQFMVVFVDFIAAHSMGLGGLGILVPVSQLYPQLLAATNPIWFMGTWGSKGVLLLALIMEFLGFCHFSWGLFTAFIVLRKCFRGKDAAENADVGSVGQAVDISGGAVSAEDMDAVDDADELQRIVIEQKYRIAMLKKTLDAAPETNEM